MQDGEYWTVPIPRVIYPAVKSFVERVFGPSGSPDNPRWFITDTGGEMMRIYVRKDRAEPAP
jgi:hypothetical protein